MLRSLWKGRNSLHQRRMVTMWRLTWMAILLIGEWLVFSLSVARCPWPSSISPLDDPLPQRVLLIADPQVTDAYSYDRTGILLWLTEFYSDLYMRRSYHHLTNSKQPEQIVFLGDLMDGGRNWDDQGWDTQLKRFYRSFNKQSTIPTLYMSGNHDIGIRDGIKPDIFQRFQSQFGPTSSIHSLAYNHTMVILDTVAMTNTNPKTKSIIQQEAWTVMDEMKMMTVKSGERVLLTHVPLYRPEETSCGPHRVQSRPFIYQNYGYQYQNMMESDISQTILQHIQPDLIFSGDDHDFCEVTHEYRTQEQQQALEFTVPTFSMSQGVRVPGYMLLQATRDRLVPQLCWLPDQLGIFINYGVLAGLTLISFFGQAFLLSYGGFDRKKKMKRMKQEDEEELVNSVGGSELGMASVNSNPASTSSSPVRACLRDIKDVIIVAFPFYIVCVLFL
ncbi:Metallo-dependent phosphatase-like protein [Chlamydoabsidia padenii]|nr:Metallo-dependent phosphatase-like protein [Chlamydoabsidia padenii]